MDFNDFIKSARVIELIGEFVLLDDGEFPKSSEGKKLKTLLHLAYNEGADQSLLERSKYETQKNTQA